MIDFTNASFIKLHPVPENSFADLINPLLLSGEKITNVFQGIRDGVVFTDKRIIAINIQGITGKKKGFTVLPYSMIQVFSVETAGMLDLDSELDMWFAGLGHVRFEFTPDTDIAALCRRISEHVL